MLILIRQVIHLTSLQLSQKDSLGTMNDMNEGINNISIAIEESAKRCYKRSTRDITTCNSNFSNYSAGGRK